MVSERTEFTSESVGATLAEIDVIRTNQAGIILLDPKDDSPEIVLPNNILSPKGYEFILHPLDSTDYLKLQVGIYSHRPGLHPTGVGWRFLERTTEEDVYTQYCGAAGATTLRGNKVLFDRPVFEAPYMNIFLYTEDHLVRAIHDATTILKLSPLIEVNKTA